MTRARWAAFSAVMFFAFAVLLLMNDGLCLAAAVMCGIGYLKAVDLL